jgi:hypothetical protein
MERCLKGFELEEVHDATLRFYLEALAAAKLGTPNEKLDRVVKERPQPSKLPTTSWLPTSRTARPAGPTKAARCSCKWLGQKKSPVRRPGS